MNIVVLSKWTDRELMVYREHKGLVDELLVEALKRNLQIFHESFLKLIKSVAPNAEFVNVALRALFFMLRTKETVLYDVLSDTYKLIARTFASAEMKSRNYAALDAKMKLVPENAIKTAIQMSLFHNLDQTTFYADVRYERAFEQTINKFKQFAHLRPSHDSSSDDDTKEKDDSDDDNDSDDDIEAKDDSDDDEQKSPANPTVEEIINGADFDYKMADRYQMSNLVYSEMLDWGDLTTLWERVIRFMTTTSFTGAYEDIFERDLQHDHIPFVADIVILLDSKQNYVGHIYCFTAGERRHLGDMDEIDEKAKVVIGIRTSISNFLSCLPPKRQQCNGKVAFNLLTGVAQWTNNHFIIRKPLDNMEEIISKLSNQRTLTFQKDEEGMFFINWLSNETLPLKAL